MVKPPALLGTTPDTLRKWESRGELLPHRKTRGGTRYYSMGALLGLRTDEVPTIGYARVSSHDQKADLDRQHAALKANSAAQGWRSYNHQRPRVSDELPEEGLAGASGPHPALPDAPVGLTHKDRLPRFGTELVFTPSELQGIEIVIIHAGWTTQLRGRTCPGRAGNYHCVFSTAVLGTKQETPAVAGYAERPSN